MTQSETEPRPTALAAPDESQPITAPQTDPATERNSDTGDTITIRRTKAVQRREWWKDMSQIFANIMVPVAIAVAAIGLYMEKVQRGQDAANRQIELLYSEGLTSAQVVLFNLWRGQDMRVLENAVTRKFVDEFVSRRIDASTIDPNEITSAIVSLTSYFDRIETCIASSRCDEEEIVTQIGDYGRDFHCFYAGQIEALRSQRLILYLGAGLAAFAERSGGCAQ